MAASMECHCLRFSELPHTTKLFAAFVEDFQRVAQFYAHVPDEEGARAAAREVRLSPEVRRSVVSVLREQSRGFGADVETELSLARLEKGAVAVVTGQQVGLFSGPAYSFYKALSAVTWARHLTERGVDAVPVFWLATEDHDLAEVNHCFWSSGKGLKRLELAPDEDAAGRRVGEISLGQPVSAIVRTAIDTLEGSFRDEVARALQESYRREETLGSAFGKLMAQLLPRRGIVLLDPLDPRLHRLAAGIYRQALEQSEELARELIARNKLLDRSGYHGQVKVTQQSTLLFLNVDGKRQPLRRRNGKFSAAGANYTAAELLAAIDKSPEAFSANVLLRPIVQDSLLPTAAYIGGPAELAYMAQAEVVYRRLLGRMPAILPRASFTLVEPAVARLMTKYGIELRDVLRGRQHLRSQMERKFLSKALAKKFAGDEKALLRLLRGLHGPLGRLDKTLLGALGTAERKMLYQFQKLRGKASRAENYRTGLLDRHERMIVDSLYPHRGLQERTLCLVPFLALHGPELLEKLEQQAAPGAAHHQVLFL